MEQKYLFQSMLRKGLSGGSPVAFRLKEFGATEPELTPEGRVIEDSEFFEGAVFYRGERYTVVYPEPQPLGARGPHIEYAVVHINSARDELWSLGDHPHLVLDVLGMKRTPRLGVDIERLTAAWGADAPTVTRAHVVDQRAMQEFVATYGPLTPSFAPQGRRTEEAMIDEMSMYLHDDRVAGLSGNFSEPLWRLHAVARAAQQDARQGIVSCLSQIELSPPRTLYRALLLQLLEHLLLGAPLHCCEGCGRWFSFSDDPSQARHRGGWKRRDARYHSRACLKAASERRRRARDRDLRAG